MKEIGDIYSRCSGEDGEFAPGDKEVADRLVNKLKTAQELTSGQYVELDAKVSFINTNKSRLEDEKDTVAEQILGIEQIDMAEAITNVSWEQYCYNAALKIGNQLLSQSLIDYMN